jgi:hypothetical protein
MDAKEFVLKMLKDTTNTDLFGAEIYDINREMLTEIAAVFNRLNYWVAAFMNDAETEGQISVMSKKKYTLKDYARLVSTMQNIVDTDRKGLGLPKQSAEIIVVK